MEMDSLPSHQILCSLILEIGMFEGYVKDVLGNVELFEN